MAGDGFLSQFQSNVGGDFALGYLFYVKIVSSPGDVAIPDNQKFLVRSSTIPEITIDAIEVPWQGMTYKFGSTQTFAEWSCTFNAEKQMNLRKAMHDWSNAVHNPQNNAHGSPSEYFGEIDIELLDPQGDFSGGGEPIYTVTLYGAWPSSVGSMDLAYDSKDVGQFDVTFTYLYHAEEQG